MDQLQENRKTDRTNDLFKLAMKKMVAKLTYCGKSRFSDLLAHCCHVQLFFEHVDDIFQVATVMSDAPES